jgi:hypothetical protein
MNQRRHRPGSGAWHQDGHRTGGRRCGRGRRATKRVSVHAPTASAIGSATASAVGSAASDLTGSSLMTFDDSG